MRKSSTKILLVLPSHKFDIFIEGLVRHSSANFTFSAILFDKPSSEVLVPSSKSYSKIYSLGKLTTQSFLMNVYRCRRIIKSHKPEIIHVTSYLSGLTIACSLFMFPKKPKLLWNRHYNKGHHNLSNRIHVVLDRLLTNIADKTVVISHAQLETLVYAERCKRSKLSIVNNGIDIDLLKHSDEGRQYFRNLFRQTPDEIILLSVGRLHPEKDFPTLFKALQKFQEMGFTFNLYIAGDGEAEYKSYLEDCISAMGLQSKVIFLGWVEEIHSAMLECDILVQSSIDEAFGLSILEALALQVPVATTTPGGVIEIVSGFHTFVAPGDFSQLANVLAEKLTSSTDDLLFIMSTIKKKFSISRMAAEYNDVYTELLKK